MKVLGFIILLLSIAGTAQAFEPECGNRAYPIAGRDLVAGDYYDLEALRGKWVFLEFWASW